VILGGAQRLVLNQAANLHSWALAATCAALLSFNFSSGRLPTITWPFNDSSVDERESDAALQKAADAALAGREGAIIIMDAQTGRVRAVVNPQLAFGTPMMPGSTMKPFTALAALRSGLIDADTRTVCPGRFTGRDFSVACVHDDHLPPFTPSQAIAYSCNYYFATLGERLSRDQLVGTLRQFGFGQSTGRVENEADGTVRPCESGNSARVRVANHVVEQSDCSAREAIGESDHIQVTPMQLLGAYAALLNGGRLLQPQIAPAKSFQAIERGQLDVSTRERTIIADGLRGAVRYGTARRARLDSLPLTILGKTGTALPPKGFRTNGWFVGFAGPVEAKNEIEPSSMKLAVLILLSRAHGSEAAAVARPIFETYANEVGHRVTESQEISSNNQESKINVSPSPRLPLAASPIRVHLVHDNITQQLSLEDYVLGVMRAEGTMESEPEALKALAIAIRTYAVKNAGRHARDGYDFCSTTHCQRFVGSNPTAREGAGTLADARVSAAVRTTEGQVLLDEHGQLVESYFGASCGGETADIGTLWGVAPHDYLHGNRDEYCASGAHAKWTDTISRADLLRALQTDPRTDVGRQLDQVVVSKRDETGRAEYVTLEGESRKLVRGWDFKIIVGRVLGWSKLKSSRFEVSRAGSNFVFKGSGFGHGLGLCQEGAHVMAARGMSYQKILQKYFPGTTLKNRAVAALPPHRAEKLRLSGWTQLHNFNPGEAKPRRIELSALERKAIGFPHWRGGKAANSATTATKWDADIFARGTFLRKANVRAESAPRFLTISSEHFRVTYPSDVNRRDADQILNALESARADYVHRASSASIPIVNLPLLEIRVNESTGDFTSRTGQPWWAAAATKGNRIELQPAAILKGRGVLTTTLRHELAHVIIDAVSGNHAPRWLAEGFAIYLAGEGKQFSNHVKRAALSPEELERRLAHPTSQQEMKSLYAQAYLLVVQMIKSEGETGVWKKLAAG
jgi:SpoIID/LytB domain protein